MGSSPESHLDNLKIEGVRSLGLSLKKDVADFKESVRAICVHFDFGGDHAKNS